MHSNSASEIRFGEKGKVGMRQGQRLMLLVEPGKTCPFSLLSDQVERTHDEQSRRKLTNFSSHCSVVCFPIMYGNSQIIKT